MKILQTPFFQNTFGRLLMLCGKTKSHLEEQIYCITIIIIFQLQKVDQGVTKILAKKKQHKNHEENARKIT